MNWKVFYRNTKFEYAVCESSEIRNVTTGTVFKPQVNFQGYFYIRYGGRENLIKETVHRIVAKAFVPNPKNWNAVNHIDGNKLNNAAENLEWVSHNENMRHVAVMGLIKNQRCRKLTSDEVWDIRTLALYGFKAGEIARSFGMHENSIRKILNCEDWRHEKMPERKADERSFHGKELQDGFEQDDQGVQRYHTSLYGSEFAADSEAAILSAGEPGFNPKQPAGIHEVIGACK